MSSSDPHSLRSASSAEVLEALRAGPRSGEELQAVLINAFERLAAMEDRWEEFRKAFNAWDRQFGRSPPD